MILPCVCHITRFVETSSASKYAWKLAVQLFFSTWRISMRVCTMHSINTMCTFGTKDMWIWDLEHIVWNVEYTRSSGKSELRSDYMHDHLILLEYMVKITVPFAALTNGILINSKTQEKQSLNIVLCKRLKATYLNVSHWSDLPYLVQLLIWLHGSDYDNFWKTKSW